MLLLLLLLLLLHEHVRPPVAGGGAAGGEDRAAHPRGMGVGRVEESAAAGAVAVQRGPVGFVELDR